jgi:beta-glucosidase
MKPLFYAQNTPELTEREIKHRDLAREICAEGIVLLENNGVLPLNTKKVALYGAGARHTVFGGTGSGENNPRHSVNIEEGLKNAGINIVNEAWLNEYDEIYERELSGYKKNLKKAMRKVPLMQHMDYAADNPFYIPSGRPVTKDDSSDEDVAVYVLARQAGEGADRKDIPGDYYATEDELKLMRSIVENHKDTVLVLNVGAVIDLSFLDEISFSAVVLLMQGGMESGNALADILTGKVNPSGRLADTWAYKYEDYPSSDTFSERNPDMHQEDYREGIFVGYRWFDKKGIKPRYKFGYGLSYTSFKTEADYCANRGTKVSVNVRVTNTGNTAGKEVTMLFLSCPENKLIREKSSLVAFAKTMLLEPGKKDYFSVDFDLKYFAAFDNDNHQFILEKGEYVVYLNDTPLLVLELDEDAVTEKTDPISLSDRKIDYIIHNKSERDIPSDIRHGKIKASEIKCITHKYTVSEFEKNTEIDQIVSGLTYKDMSKLLVGRTYLGPFRHRVFGAVGYTTSKLFNKGIDAMPMADGPQGLNLTQISTKPKHNLFAIPTLPESLRHVHKISKIGSASDKNKDQELFYQYCTSWPSETVVAQTWSTYHAKLLGSAVAKEMLEYGVVFWLAPALNIHRNPLCGRNYEYYSEDPVLTGIIASRVIRGVHEEYGCYPTIKHFAANNLETKRNVSSSNLDERTLREIYLRAFRIAVETAHPEAVMCSYNKINGIYTALNYDLQTKILRNEWGFDGIVMTDWFATGHHESLDELCCKAGTDLIMPGLPHIPSKIMKALKKGLISGDDIERSARRIIKLAIKTHLNRTNR